MYTGIAVTLIFLIICVAAMYMYSVSIKASDEKDEVCMSKAMYDKLTSAPTVVYKEKVVNVPIVYPSHDTADVVENRDRRVVEDDLYPAVNRTSAHLFRDFHVHKDVFNIPTQHGSDTYRLVGYLKNDSDPNGTWKLFGRDKDRNRGEFYIIPTNNINDIKIQITDSVISGREKLRSLDTIPDTLTFNSPLLSKTPYTFVELPKGDLTDLRYA